MTCPKRGRESTPVALARATDSTHARYRLAPLNKNNSGHCGKEADPLYQAGRTLLTGVALLTEKQQARIDPSFADERQVEVVATEGAYQDMITAYRKKGRSLGRYFLQHPIDCVSAGVPNGMVEIRRLARTITQRTADVLGYFDHSWTTSQLKQSTAGWNTFAAPRSASEIWPIMLREVCSTLVI